MHDLFHMRKFRRALLFYLLEHFRAVGYDYRIDALKLNDIRSEDFFAVECFNGTTVLRNYNFVFIDEFDIACSQNRHKLQQPVKIVSIYRPDRALPFEQYLGVFI